MSLLIEIQEGVIEQGSEIGPLLLKLRLLASLLGSIPLIEWVKHESEGYPTDAEVPSYRIIPVSYSGTFLGPFGSSITNAPIPTYLVKSFGGDEWVNYRIRQSVAAIDDLLDSSSKTGATPEIESSNLMLLLQGKIYPNYSCNSVHGKISRASLCEVQYAVRSRILDLTMEFEKSVPDAKSIGIRSNTALPSSTKGIVNNIAQQIIYGSVNSVANTGDDASTIIMFVAGDKIALARDLVASGISNEDAEEFSNILASEKPDDAKEAFGVNAKKWIAKNINKALDGSWKIGIDVATKVLTEAALRYYGMK